METTTKNKTSETQPAFAEKKEIVINRVFDLPVNKVWKAWSDIESLKKWWGPKGFTCPYASIDFRTGGKYLQCMRSPEGKDFWSTGVYKEIIPEKKIVVTDSFSDKDGKVISASDLNMPGKWPLELLVTVNFEKDGEKTKMKLQHRGIPDEMHDECTQGWNESLDKIEKNLR